MISSKTPGGPWESGSTWVGGQVPEPNDSVNIVAGSKVTIAAGKAVVIGSAGQGSLVIAKGGSLSNSGTLTNDSDLTNFGTLTNSGTIVNNASMANNGSATLNNSGTLQLNGLGIVYATEFPPGAPPMPNFTGLFFSQGVFVQQPGSTIVLGTGTRLFITPFAGEDDSFAIPADASLVVSNGASLTIQGNAVVDNAGTISNSGTFAIMAVGGGQPPGALSNSGTITNNAGVMPVKFPKGKPYQTWGAINNDGTITNGGTLNNGWSGRTVEPILVQPAITNTGTINNSKAVTNYGTIDNNGVINNSGVFHKDGGVFNGSAIKGNPPVP